MLTKTHLKKHREFLEHLFKTSSKYQIKKIIQSADEKKLRALAQLIGAVHTRQVPVPKETREKILRSPKKKFLDRHFNSWTKIKQTFKGQSLDFLRQFFIGLVSILPAFLSVFFARQ